MGFRLEIWYQDGSKVGSMLTGQPVYLPSGTGTVRLSLDLSHLTDGRYRADLIAYQLVDAQREYVLDRVYPGLVFAVQNGETHTMAPEWNHPYWGSIRLHDMRPVGR